MKASQKTMIKEGLQKFKYELMFIKHKLDLVETLISGLEENVYSDELPDYDEGLLGARVNLLFQEYQKLHTLIDPRKVHFNTDEFEPETTII